MDSKNQKQTYKIISIYVTFNPDFKILEESLKSVTAQCNKIIIVDNNSDNFPEHIEKLFPDITVLKCEDNNGVGAALNKGIEFAIKDRADIVVLFDQDSIPADDMVDKLIEVFYILRNEGKNIAAIGPKIVIDRSVSPVLTISFKRFIGCFRKNIRGSSEKMRFVRTDYVITSGSLIPIDSLNKVGQFREDFFIDYIDVEWGIRAGSKNFFSFGVPSAVLYHNLGETYKCKAKNLFFFGAHAPSRYFFICRNGIWLAKLPHIPFFMKIFFFILSSARPLMLPFSSIPHKIKSLKFMLRGIFAGIFKSPNI